MSWSVEAGWRGRSRLRVYLLIVVSSSSSRPDQTRPDHPSRRVTSHSTLGAERMLRER